MHTVCLLPVSPSMHCLGGTCTWSGGTWSPRGVPGLGVYLVLGGALVPRGCTWSWGCIWSQEGCTWSWGVYLVQRHVPGVGRAYLPRRGVPGPGGCTWSQGVCLLGVPAQVLPLWTESQTGVKNITLPQTSFSGGKKELNLQVKRQQKLFKAIQNLWKEEKLEQVSKFFCCFVVSRKIHESGLKNIGYMLMKRTRLEILITRSHVPCSLWTIKVHLLVYFIPREMGRKMTQIIYVIHSTVCESCVQ